MRIYPGRLSVSVSHFQSKDRMCEILWEMAWKIWLEWSWSEGDVYRQCSIKKREKVCPNALVIVWDESKTP